MRKICAYCLSCGSPLLGAKDNKGLPTSSGHRGTRWEHAHTHGRKIKGKCLLRLIKVSRKKASVLQQSFPCWPFPLKCNQPTSISVVLWAQPGPEGRDNVLLLNDIRVECHNLTARRPESSPEQPRGGGMKKKKKKSSEGNPDIFQSSAQLRGAFKVQTRPSTSKCDICPSGVCVWVCVTAGAHQKRSIKTSISLCLVCFRAVGWPRPLCFLWALCVFLPRMPLYKAVSPKGSALPHLVGVQHYTHTGRRTVPGPPDASLLQLLVKIDPLSGSSSVLLK